MSAETVESIKFTCTQDEFRQAQRFHHTLPLRGRRFVTRISLFAIGLGLFFAILTPGDAINRVEGALLGAAMFLGVMAIFVLVNRLVFLPRASRRQFSQRKDVQASVKFDIRPPKIGITSKNGFSFTPTEEILKWAENGSTILLYRSDNLFNFIPRRAINESFYADLMAELTRAAVPKARFSNS